MVCLRLPDGRVTADPAEMRRHAVDFYTDLFRAESCDAGAAAELLQGLPQLSQGDQDTLGADLTLEELGAAVSQMTSGRAPGFNGLPSDFFKHFWSVLGQDLLDVFGQCFKDGTLPASCRRAVLSLLPKRGDLALLKNWRPVALLCTDYKILSKVLSNRLKNFLQVVIGLDQSYCVPDRSKMDNLFLMRDVFDVCRVGNLKIGLISIDQEKSFDRVDYSFLFYTLGAFGVGEVFLSWVKLLYSGASCMVKVGGGLSCPIPVGRGIRQGCPISGLLYSLAVKPLICRLRNRIKGLSLLTQAPPIVVSAYADDINVLVRDQEDIEVLRQSLATYERASSARVNWGKSEACLMGRWSGEGSPKLPGNLQWGNRGLKVLGVYLGSGDYERQNWVGVLDKVKARL